MANIYITATDHINNHPYEVMVQAHTTVNFSNKNTAPFYEPMDHTIPQKSRIPISKMVEYFISRSSFTIIHDKDVLEILHQIDAYVKEVYPLKNINSEVEAYLEKILKFRERIYFLFRRVLNNHPQWKDSYKEQVGVFGVISELYSSIGMKVDVPESLMEDLRICPTVREYETQKSKEIMQQPVQHGGGIYDV